MTTDRPRPLTSLDIDRMLSGCKAYDDGVAYDTHADEHWQAGWLARSAQRGDNRAPFVNPARSPAAGHRPRPASPFEATVASILGRAAQELGRLGRADLAREALDQGLRVAAALGPHAPGVAAQIRTSLDAVTPAPAADELTATKH